MPVHSKEENAGKDKEEDEKDEEEDEKQQWRPLPKEGDDWEE